MARFRHVHAAVACPSLAKEVLLFLSTSKQELELIRTVHRDLRLDQTAACKAA